MIENPHKGHRGRMFDKVIDGHVSSLTDVELLEMILFGTIKRSNTNVTAHNLINKFGSMKNLFNADILQICSADGVGPKSAAFITVIGEIHHRMNAEGGGKSERRFVSIDQMGEFFIKKFRGMMKECVMLLALDNKNAPIDCKIIHEGTVNSSRVSVRTVIKTALDLNAARVVIAHNHPSGDASPSDDDIVLTRILRRALSEIELDLVEHILVADDRYMPLLSYIMRATEFDYRN